MPSKKLPRRIFAQNQRKANWPLRIAIAVLLAGAAGGAYWRFAPLGSEVLAKIPPAMAPEPATPAEAMPAPLPGEDVIAAARALLAGGDAAGARARLQPKLDTPEPAALLLAAEIDASTNNLAGARALLQQVTDKFPASAEAPLASGRIAKFLEAEGQTAAAEAIFARLRDTAPKGLRAGGLLGFARKAERENDLAGARDLYRQALADAPPESVEWNEALDQLGRLNVALIFSPAETPDSKYYAVEKGDSLTSIGIKLNTTQGLLTRANGITEDARLNLGQRLKYTPKDFRIVVERATCRIYLLDNEGIFKRYRTGLGMPGHETALGNYTIGNKQKDPVWHPQGRPPVPSGDPNNELGTRWMPLVPVDQNLPNDLGIHGTIAPETIGQYKSHGCPRMLKDDVEELYDLVVRATPVQIVERIQWDEVLKPPVLAGGGASPGTQP